MILPDFVMHPFSAFPSWFGSCRFSAAVFENHEFNLKIRAKDLKIRRNCDTIRNWLRM